MKYEVKNRFHGSIIFNIDADSMAEAIAIHLRGSDADLIGADLIGADLIGVNLSGVNLIGANLIGANLSDANLSDANLSDANLSDANLIGANLSDANLSDANLSDANLSDANLSDANLSDANLRGVNLSDLNLRDCPVKIDNIHQTVYQAATAKSDSLDMGNWHKCETTHCRAGWVTHLAGEAGRALEFAFGSALAATYIYMASDPKLERVPDFYCSNDDALADMKRLAELENVA